MCLQLHNLAVLLVLSTNEMETLLNSEQKNPVPCSSVERARAFNRDKLLKRSQSRGKMQSTADLPAWALLLHLCMQYKCLHVPALVVGLLFRTGTCTPKKHCCFHPVLGWKPPALDVAETVATGIGSSVAAPPLCGWEFALWPKRA